MVWVIQGYYKGYGRLGSPPPHHCRCHVAQLWGLGHTPALCHRYTHTGWLGWGLSWAGLALALGYYPSNQTRLPVRHCLPASPAVKVSSAHVTGEFGRLESSEQSNPRRYIDVYMACAMLPVAASHVCMAHAVMLPGCYCPRSSLGDVSTCPRSIH